MKRMIVMKTYKLLIIILLTLFVSLAINFSCHCGDDDDSSNDDDGNDDDGNDDDEVKEEVWTDPTSGLMWQLRLIESLAWPTAKRHCDNLNYGGYKDWHLPSIGELRTLIRGCPATETGGSCGVTDDCLYENCHNLSCYTPCDGGKGPTHGIYWPAELGGTYDGFQWSSSVILDDEGDDDDDFWDDDDDLVEEWAWTVRFSDATVWDLFIEDYDDGYCYRPTVCVREDNVGTN